MIKIYIASLVLLIGPLHAGDPQKQAQKLYTPKSLLTLAIPAHIQHLADTYPAYVKPYDTQNEGLIACHQADADFTYDLKEHLDSLGKLPSEAKHLISKTLILKHKIKISRNIIPWHITAGDLHEHKWKFTLHEDMHIWTTLLESSWKKSFIDVDFTYYYILDLSDRVIPHIPITSLKGLDLKKVYIAPYRDPIEKLDLRNRHITDIPGDVLANMFGLREIKLYKGQLSEAQLADIRTKKPKLNITQKEDMPTTGPMEYEDFG